MAMNKKVNPKVQQRRRREELASRVAAAVNESKKETLALKVQKALNASCACPPSLSWGEKYDRQAQLAARVESLTGRKVITASTRPRSSSSSNRIPQFQGATGVIRLKSNPDVNILDFTHYDLQQLNAQAARRRGK